MISHVKIVILTHIVEIRRLKVKYIVNLWIKDTSIQGTKCCVPLCPLKRGSTVYVRKGVCNSSNVMRLSMLAPTPPPGTGWGNFLVWNGRFSPGVGILNR